MCHLTRYARHRLIDSIKGRRKAGETIASLMRDFDLSRAAIVAALSSTPDDSRMTQQEIRERKGQLNK